MGADSPGKKFTRVSVPRRVTCKGQIGGAGPPRGRTPKSATPPKSLNPIFSKLSRAIFPKFFVHEGAPKYFDMDMSDFAPRTPEGRHVKIRKTSLFGGCPPNGPPEPCIPYGQCRDPRGAHEGEIGSGLAPLMAEKSEFENFSLAPPSGQTGNGRGHVTSSSGRGRGGLQPSETDSALRILNTD